MFRAHCCITDWEGPVRDSLREAEGDADRRSIALGDRTGWKAIGHHVVVTADADGYAVDAEFGNLIWPSWGRSCGAVRF